MDNRDQARSALAAALEIWQAPDADDQAEMDWLKGLIDIELDQRDLAQQHVATSVRHWRASPDRRAGVLGEITLAQLYVEAGDRAGPDLAHRAIAGVRELHSVRARERLEPLARALAGRPDNGAQELARYARREMAVT
jgi:hypothetical protein